jgi:hypothetical protein
MRRTFAAAVALVALSGTAHSAPAPQLRDRPGDWSVASQDIVSGRVSSTRAGKKLFLRGELKLAAAPAAPTMYRFKFVIDGCHEYGFVYIWTGSGEQSDAFLDHTDYCRVRYAWELPGEDRYPVTFGVRGTTLTWQTPYVGAIKKGAPVDMFAGLACSSLCGVQVRGLPVATPGVALGDEAFTDGWYRVGSDLPRK